jgi:hypothetical protein
MSNAARITVRRGSQNYGPYELRHVNDLLAQGRLSPNDLAWVEGTPEWTRLGHVPGAVPVPPPVRIDGEEVSERPILPALLLAIITPLGMLGIHRFYVGKVGSGIAMLILTLTGIGSIVTFVWSTIDWILIVCGAFRDDEDRRLVRWL